MELRKIDFRVAEMLGWSFMDGDHHLWREPYTPIAYNDESLPDFSLSIDDAWRVVDFLHAKGWVINVATYDKSCTCILWSPEDRDKAEPTVHMPSVTAPLAICLAALEALGG